MYLALVSEKSVDVFATDPEVRPDRPELEPLWLGDLEEVCEAVGGVWRGGSGDRRSGGASDRPVGALERWRVVSGAKMIGLV